QALADEATMQGELQLIIGRLEDFAAKLHDGLEAADWASKRDLIRALVKRVEVARDDVNIVFRIDPYPGDADPETKSLQLCRGRDDAALGRAPIRGMEGVPFQVSRLQPFAQDDLIHGDMGQEPVMADAVKTSLDVAFEDPGGGVRLVED